MNKRNVVLMCIIFQASLILVFNVKLVIGQVTNQPPVADFSASPRLGIELLTVTFSDASTSSDGVVSWFWDFGDGNTSSDPNPTHVYAAGTFTVSLTVTEPDGDSDTETKSDYIEVTPWSNRFTVTDAGGPYSGTEGTAISFDGSASSDLGGTIVSWFWDFGDGENSNKENPTHIYVQEGNYVVTLTVTDDESMRARDDKDTTSAIVSDLDPVADFSASPTSGTAPLSVIFSDLSTSYDGISSWLWDFGDDQTSTEQNPTHVYTQGVYTVSLTVEEEDGDINTQTKKDSISIKLPPVADAGGAYSGTEGVAISFDSSGSYDPDGTIVSYLWEFGDGETSINQNPIHVYAKEGTYSVTLTVTDDDSTEDTDTTQAIVADTEPLADFSATPTNGWEPLIVKFSDKSTSYDGVTSYSWDFGDGKTSSDRNPTHTYTKGKYTVKLTITESDGDTDTRTRVNYIDVVEPPNKAPVADAAGSYSGTEGKAISLDGSGSSDSDGTIVSYLWDFGDGEISTDQNPMHFYEQDGTYSVTLTVTDDDSTEDTDTTQAIVADTEPLAGFTASPTSGITPLTVSFTDSSISYDGIVSWLWDFGNGETSSNKNPTHTYIEGIYRVSLTIEESDGDIDTLTKQEYIIVEPPPNVPPVANFGIQSSAIPAINETVTFKDQSIDSDGTVTSWSWNFGDGTTSTIQNPNHQYQLIGTYTVTLTVKDDDGSTDTKTEQITIHEVYPPQTTENYDGLWHNSDFTITLSATDDYSGVSETYYKINNGPTRQLSVNGQPRITSEGTDNTLEYWSVDNVGNEETHHTILHIKLDKTAPTADAGQDMTVNEEAIVLFDGSNSIDNVAITSYKWNLFDVTLQTLDGVNPQYIFHTPGVYIANLTVSDAVLNSAFDTITVTVIDISDPISNAGDDQVVHEGVTVTFDGSASTDNVGIVSYRWDFIDVVSQQLVGVNPTYTFQSAGVHEVTLTVLDNQGYSGTDKVAVTVIDDTWPAANAGPDQIVEEDKWVVFDGSSSSDNVGIISYVWTFTDEKLQTMQGVNVTYVFETPGIYVVTLTVSDAEGLSSNDTVTIIVRDVTAPTIEIEDYSAVIENVPITFNASAFDNAGVVNYNWIFDDGTSENTSVSTVKHTYTESGIYNVELTVIDITGNVNGTFISIVVYRDTDGDLLADHLDADDDGDGIPDEWESRYDLDPMDPSDAIRDSDGDGVSNLEEYARGKDPKVYDISNYTLSIVLVIAVILSMISFGIFYSRTYRSK